MIEKKDVYKVVIMGEKGVGKQTLFRRSASSVFKESIKETIGADFGVKNVDIDRRTVTLRIWDLASEDRFRVLLPAFVKGADGALFIYDVTNRSSLTNIDDWLLVLRYFIKSEKDIFPVIVVGNKADLEDAREVNRDEGIEFAKSGGVDGFIECSFKTGKNVPEMFKALIRLMLRKSNLLNIV